MTTATQFQHRLDELKLPETFEPEAASGLHTELRQLLEDVTREMQVIRGQYHSRLTAAQVANRRRADEIERLEHERDEKMQPYQEVREKVEALLVQVEEKLGGAKPASA